MDPQAIVDVRVLAARASVVQDPSLASPAAGEQVAVNWLIAGPEGDAEVRYGLVGCVSTPGTALVRCERTLATETATAPAMEIETMVIDVPSDAARLGVQGVFCDGGTPVVGSSPGEHRCQGKVQKQMNVTFDIYLAVNGFSNRLPQWQPSAVSMDGAPLLSSDQPCDGTVAADGRTHQLSLDLSGMREDGEELVVAHYATDGALERHYTAVESDEAEPPAVQRLTWKAPTRQMERPARLYFVARDGRGGVDWIFRDICVGDSP